MSLFSASFVIALCRRKSTRLVAVIGGLVIALGILFASFATLVHQVALSYCEYSCRLSFNEPFCFRRASVALPHHSASISSESISHSSYLLFEALAMKFNDFINFPT